MEIAGVCSDCVKWSRKYSKVDAGRNALRQTVAILEKRVDELIQQNSTLKKDVEELQSRDDIKREALTKDCDARVALEKEIADLKSEILTLQQCRDTRTPDTDQQVTRISDLENEISKLNKLLDEEKLRTNAALKNVQVEKTKATEAREAAKLEKSKAVKEKTRAAAESKRAQEYKIQLDALKNEAAEARSQLNLATSKSEEANSRLQAEKKKASEEQRKAHLLKSESEKLKSLIEEYEKKLSDEKRRVGNLSSQLDEERKNSEEKLKTIDQLQKKIVILEESSKNFMMSSKAQGDKGVNAENPTTFVKTGKTKASRSKKNADSQIAKVKEQTQTQTDMMKSVEEKWQGDKSTHTVQGVGETIEASAQVNPLTAHSQYESEVDVQPEKVINVLPRKNSCGGPELELSKEQIKIAKTQAKRIIKKFRKSSLKKEMDILKQYFLQFSNTLEFLDRSLSREAKGANVLVEAKHCPCSRRKEQKLLDVKLYQLERERENPFCMLHMPSNIACHHSKQALCPPDYGINIADSTSFTETNTKLERPAGASFKDLNVSSAKNSSGASFSDCWSMTSQGKFDSSTTSANPADSSSLQMIDSRLFGDVTELMHSNMPSVMSKTGVKSRSNDIPDGGPVRCKKRKRILTLLESVQCGLSDSKKVQMQMEENISILHKELQSQMATPAEPSSAACNNQHDMFCESCKKKEIFHNQKVSAQCLPNGVHAVAVDNENLELSGVTADLGMKALEIVPVNNLTSGAKVCQPTNVASSNENGHNPNVCAGQITDGDYMVLFDLDDHDEERCYRLARENVLSPSLPEIKFHRGNAYSVDGADRAIEDSSNAEVSGPDCIPHVNPIDDSSILKEYGTWTTSKPLVQRDTADCFDIKDIEHGARDVPAERSSLKVHVNRETRSPCETLFSDDFPSLCVVHLETIDHDNLYKVFDATRKGASQCHLSSPPDVPLERVLDYIKSIDQPSKEKACVFFSMILAGSHGAVARVTSLPIRESDDIPNSFMADIFSAINDVNIRNCLARTFCVHELLNVISEFLMEGKLWVCRTPDRNDSESDGSSVSVPVDNMMLFLEAASTEQLVVASTILASLSVSFDEIDFIILLSYNLFRLRKYNHTAASSVIHVFAQLAGKKFLTSTSNSLLASVVNSLISLLESSQSPCPKLLVSEQVVSLDNVIDLLLKRLRSLMEMAKTKIVQDDSQEVISYIGVSDVGSSPSLEETFTQFTDVLSLLELIANTVSWDILSSKIVPQLILELESSAVNIFSVAIIVFLGQLGRLGVSANGSEDTWVATIRCRLSSMLGVNSSKNLMFPIQIASVCSLLKFVHLDPNSLFSSEGMEAFIDEASPACQIRTWFTSLSEEQQTVFMSILKEAPPL